MGLRQLFLGILLLTSVGLNAQQTPGQVYGELFIDVQNSRIFPDSKTFVDCIPKKDPRSIVSDYLSIKNNPAVRFSLKMFVEENFIIPQQPAPEMNLKKKALSEHIETLWTVLRRKADTANSGSSLLPLPYEYIIPGGRFREIYYWDSYFTMLGLKESKEYDLIEKMVQNFAYLIHTYGHVPNGNRSYYLSRSQPPFFSNMLELLAEIKGRYVYVIYQPALEKEYDYWMDKSAKTSHVVKMKDGSILNRYWDQDKNPREESYLEDIETANQRKFYPEREEILFRDLRSAAESGWDFSSRWLADRKKLNTIETTQIIPVDLNCLLYHMEKTLALSYTESGNGLKAAVYEQAASKRKKAIQKYCWSSSLNWYVDYNLRTGTVSRSLTLAGLYPLFFQLSDSVKAARVAKQVRQKFLKPGGVVTTLTNTGQQWDAPNGWAPLQWITIRGLENYKEQTLARLIARRWFDLNKKVYEATGKLMEKYDVIQLDREGGGGEYPSQDGFGWTNGVLLALMRKYNFE